MTAANRAPYQTYLSDCFRASAINISPRWSSTRCSSMALARDAQAKQAAATARALLQICAAGPDWIDVPSRQGGWRRGWHDAQQGVQGPAVHGRGDPVGGPMVSDVPDQLSRSRADAPGPWRRGGPHDHLPLDPGLCARAGEADPAALAPEQRLVAGR